MLIYGAGGHAKVIISCIKTNIDAIFDDDPCKNAFLNIPIINQYKPEYFPQSPLIIGIGNNQIRQHISNKIDHHFAIVSHPSALIDSSCIVEEGTVILHRATIQAGSFIGKHVIINTAANVDHDCIIQDYVHIGPGAILCGHVTIGLGTLIGAGTVITPGVTIGKNCLISAGSVVTKHIPDHAVVKGNPSPFIRLNHE